MSDITLEWAQAVEAVINHAQVTVYPVETVSAMGVLWQAQTTLRLAPGETRTVYALFRDAEGARCAAVDVITPQPDTDYAVNERADGNGPDYTTDPAFSISTALEATRLAITLGNSASGPLHVTLLQVRGHALRVHDPITLDAEDAASQAAYGRRALTLDLPQQPDEIFGAAYAAYLVGRYKAAGLRARRLHVVDRANLSGVNLFCLEIMDLVQISDTASGAECLLHRVTALEYDLRGSSFSVTLHLARADDRAYWLLGRANYGALDNHTRLGL